jgi:hypothetical protein
MLLKYVGKTRRVGCKERPFKTSVTFLPVHVTKNPRIMDTKHFTWVTSEKREATVPITQGHIIRQQPVKGKCITYKVVQI